MKTKLIALFSLLFLFGVVMISCDEESLLPETPDTQSVEDNANAESGVAGVFENVNNYGISEEGKKSLSGEPDSISWDGNTVTIDFGDDGTIVAAFSGIPTMTTPNLTASVTVTDFNTNGSKMTGTLNFTFAFNLLNPDLGPTFGISTPVGEDITFVLNDTTSSTWGGTRNIEWAEGWQTLDDDTDDENHFSGTSHGTNVDGQSYETVILEDQALVRRTDCEYITSGIMTITEPAAEEGGDPTVMVIDFGDGTCDSEMIVTIDDIEISVDQ